MAPSESGTVSRGGGPSLVSPSSSKLSLYLVSAFAILLILFNIHMTTSWDFMHQWRKPSVTTRTILKVVPLPDENCNKELESMASELQESVTFLPLKDLRYSSKAVEGHTWFMSSMLDTHEKGEVQYQEFPSKASKGRMLCLKGRDTHDGSWNSYALAWPRALPPNATMMAGLTFVAYSHYSYGNIWHGLMAVVPFVAWHIKNQCLASPERWILYYWGELRTSIGPWLTSLMEAMFGEPLNIEKFDRFGSGEESDPACFQKAVVMRHNEGGMSRERLLQVFDLLRCKARVFCNASTEGRLSEVNGKGSPVIGMTMLMRTGARSFRNDTAVIRIFRRACRDVKGCRLIVAYANNLTFCDQVKLMSSTDVLVSPHGAQLTTMFMMDRNSSVMEFFPKGWLELAGVGQYVLRWLADWSGMNHSGAWRDTDGDRCPFPKHDRRCMSIYKNSRIGYNESYFYEWARDVLIDVKLRKAQQISNKSRNPVSSSCPCSP